MAYEEIQNKQYAQAANRLLAVRDKYPELKDYIAYWLATAAFESNNGSDPVKELQPVWDTEIPSPVLPNAAILAGRTYLRSGNAAEAIRILREYYKQLPQPAGDLLLASCYESGSDRPSAAVYYQRVYYLYPATPEAAQASEELVRLKQLMGEAYPPPPVEMMFTRAERWRLSGDNQRARGEYESIVSRVAGADREIAQVRLGALDFQAYQTNSAYNYLKSLNVTAPDAEAERLYWLVECARRLDRDAELMDLIKRLADLYPKSPWRLKALVTAGNRYLVQNQPEIYEPLFKAGAEFPGPDPLAEYCHWKATWSAYVNRRPEAAEMLRTHLLNFPGSERDSAALYYLGRLSEDLKDYASAKAYYDVILERYPNHYYAAPAENRLAQPEFFGAPDSNSVSEFLNKVVWPVRRHSASFEPNRATRKRFERARALEDAGLDDLAEQELRSGAKTDGQPHLVAMRLAETNGAPPHQNLRMAKNLVPGYLSLPVDGAPPAFWRVLYPLPYRADLERNARLQGLDRFIVAGLIRQESEFNPQAVSPANAYGLTQIVPSTGRLLARRIGQRRFRPAVLFRPDVNLRLGTMYLRQLYDRHAASWEQALAAYNAGASRVDNWNTWNHFREPSEFIENIPFTETRNYVFSVLRNAQMYRNLYGSEKPATVAADTLTTKDLKAKAATVKKGGAFKRTPVVSKSHPKRPVHKRRRR